MASDRKAFNRGAPISQYPSLGRAPGLMIGMGRPVARLASLEGELDGLLWLRRLFYVLLRWWGLIGRGRLPLLHMFGQLARRGRLRRVYAGQGFEERIGRGLPASGLVGRDQAVLRLARRNLAQRLENRFRFIELEQ
jgi:hypothetical protein